MSKNPPPSAPAQRSFGRDVLNFLTRNWLPLILVILAIIFIAQNTNRANFTVFWVDISSPVWLMLTITAIVGVLVGWYVGRYRGKERG
ncbi:LapA family protein [Gordonia sp. VNK21]|uniref:LapA family protein n=1 Tax=Gordonia sp. VNK21 TaxID=3382483 RepID=UPI0038D45D4F